MTLPLSHVVVIGGGIMGMLTALNLADRGCKVTILEKGRVWSEASGVNAGSLGVQNKLLPLVPYTLAAFEIWRRLGERLHCDIDFHQTGGYKIATTVEEVERLRKGAEGQSRAGLDLRWLEPADLRREAPWLSDTILAGTYCAQDGFASPLRVGPAVRAALAAAGAVIHEHCLIRSIEAGKGIRVETSAGVIGADQLVIAAGAWTGQVAAMLGVTLPVALDVNMVSVTEPGPFTIGKMVSHARGILTLKQVSNGSCLIGGGWQGVGTLEDSRKELEFDQIIHNLSLALRIVPGLGALHVVRSWAGYEGVSPDSLPYAGRLPGHGHVYVAACSRGGFTVGPSITSLLAELIVEGRTGMPLDPFNPGRFANE